jgi:hypothetical protein
LHPPRLKEHPAQLQHSYWAQLAKLVAIKAQPSSKLQSSADWPVYGEQLKPHHIPGWYVLRFSAKSD